MQVGSITEKQLRCSFLEHQFQYQLAAYPKITKGASFTHLITGNIITVSSIQYVDDKTVWYLVATSMLINVSIIIWSSNITSKQYYNLCIWKENTKNHPCKPPTLLKWVEPSKAKRPLGVMIAPMVTVNSSLHQKKKPAHSSVEYFAVTYITKLNGWCSPQS